MKRMKLLWATIVVAGMSNAALAQWTTTGNNAYNTNYNTSPPGKIGIGLIPINNVSAGGPYTFLTPPLQVRGITNNSVPAFSPAEVFAVEGSAYDRIGFGANFIHCYYSTAGVPNHASYVLKPLTIYGAPVYINKLVAGDNLLTSPSVSTTTPGNYDIYAKNGILTGKVKVAVVNSANWADYVFDKDYKLLSLGEVESYVKKNKHLPGVPSAEQVAKDGIDMATMDAKLLEKIEELTLYMIELKKENQEMKARLESLEIKK